MNKGFTLIELLVVVLIIGILAAVALPQYQKAVERSRLAEAVQKLANLGNAQKIYYMQRGTFADSIDELSQTGDITFPSADFPSASTAGKQWHFTMNDNGDNVEIWAYRDGGIYSGTRLRTIVFTNGTSGNTCDSRGVGTDKLCLMAEAWNYSTR